MSKRSYEDIEKENAALQKRLKLAHDALQIHIRLDDYKIDHGYLLDNGSDDYFRWRDGAEWVDWLVNECTEEEIAVETQRLRTDKIELEQEVRDGEKSEAER